MFTFLFFLTPFLHLLLSSPVPPLSPLVLGTEPRSLYMLGKYFAIDPHPQLSIS